jgi:hypothetical protein
MGTQGDFVPSNLPYPSFPKRELGKKIFFILKHIVKYSA